MNVYESRKLARRTFRLIRKAEDLELKMQVEIFAVFVLSSTFDSCNCAQRPARTCGDFPMRAKIVKIPKTAIERTLHACLP